jgi:hypothetical protein
MLAETRESFGMAGGLRFWALGVDSGPRRGAFEGILDPPNNTNTYMLIGAQTAPTVAVSYCRQLSCEHRYRHEPFRRMGSVFNSLREAHCLCWAKSGSTVGGKFHFLRRPFLRSGLPRGPRRPFQRVGGFAPCLLQGSPGPPGPGRPF